MAQHSALEHTIKIMFLKTVRHNNSDVNGQGA